MVFAVGRSDAWPVAEVIAVCEGYMTDAPAPGALNVTATPGIGWFAESRSMTTRFAPKAVFTVAL